MVNFLSIVFLVMNFENCYQIKTMQEYESLLKFNNLKFEDYDIQLQTNYSYIFKLKDDSFLLIPGDSKSNGILFSDQQCFEIFYSQDKFPIENPEKHYFDFQPEMMQNIDSAFPEYKRYLENKFQIDSLRLTFEGVNSMFREILESKKSYDPIDVLALGNVLGQYYIKINVGARWSYVKRYGLYNPYYEPHIYYQDHFVSIYEMVVAYLKSKDKNGLKKMLLFPSKIPQSRLDKDQVVYKIF